MFKYLLYPLAYEGSILPQLFYTKAYLIIVPASPPQPRRAGAGYIRPE